ncbi:hypothetical protein LSAT2_025729 [Lamellibrachia satsuma]|nr:hypothetical protein LSAT2_025729 [Lamellibrachia satsuma]
MIQASSISRVISVQRTNHPVWLWYVNLALLGLGLGSVVVCAQRLFVIAIVSSIRRLRVLRCTESHPMARPLRSHLTARSTSSRNIWRYDIFRRKHRKQLYIYIEKVTIT